MLSFGGGGGGGGGCGEALTTCVRLYVFRTILEGDLAKMTKIKVSLPFDPKILVLESFPKEITE